MNDPIKDYVERHREAFDHLEAPALDLGKLKSRLQKKPEQRIKTLGLKARTWLIAASVLLLLSSTLLFLNSDREIEGAGIVKHKVDGITLPPENIKATEQVADDIPTGPIRVARYNPELNVKKPVISTRSLYAQLQDSTSASARLLAIIEIEKSGKVNKQVIDMLAATLNHDGNTNVRLAALGLMEKHSNDQHVSTLLVNSLDRQSDPMVQLGLLGIVGKLKNAKIENKLRSLANGPETFTAVRDEAFNILLNQNKF